MAKAKTGRVSIGEFKSVKYNSRKNPESIRRLVYNTVTEEFQGSLIEAEKLFWTTIPSRERRLYHGALSRNTIYRLARDETLFNYGHLEVLARFYGVPTGLLLIFTRLTAELANRRSGGLGQAKRLLDAVYESLEVIRDSLENAGSGRAAPLKPDVLKRAGQAFTTALLPEQASLPLPARPRRGGKSQASTPS